MDTSILSSSPLRKHKTGDNWKTPERAVIRGMRRSGDSWGEIKKRTGLSKSSIQSICATPTSRRTRKGKQYKKKLIKQSELERVIRWVSASWENRRALYARIKAACRIEALITTLRKTLKVYSYRRCIACRRPFISKKQAKKRLEFAEKYR